MELNMTLYLITVVEDVTMDKQGKTLNCYTVRSDLCMALHYTVRGDSVFTHQFNKCFVCTG